MRTILFLFILFSTAVVSYALNEEKQDVIYLKNKKVFKGNILKNEMGIVELLTKENGQEVIMKFQRFEIKKIVQEVNTYTDSLNTINETNNRPNIQIGGQTDPNTTGIKKGDENLVVERPIYEKVVTVPIYSNEINYPGQGLAKKISGGSDEYVPYKSLPRRRTPRVWIRNIRGFRGFMEVGYMTGIGDNKYSYIEISKSVGFQFNPYIYMGVGVSMHLSNTHEGGYPLFVNPRFNLSDNKTWTPFISLKGGYSVGDTQGWNAGVTAGTSFIFGKKGKFAFNAGIGYTYFDAKIKEYDKASNSRLSYNKNFHSIGLKLEFEY